MARESRRRFGSVFLKNRWYRSSGHPHGHRQSNLDRVAEVACREQWGRRKRQPRDGGTSKVVVTGESRGG